MYPRLAALTGEKADNCLQYGLGQKTALKLIQEYGSLDNIFANLDKMTGRTTKNLPDNVDLVRLNRKLNTLCVDVPLDITIADKVIEGMDFDKTNEFLSTISSNRLKERIFENFPVKGNAAPTIGEYEKKICLR